MYASPPRHIVAASALVRNKVGEILLVKTERRGWEFPGGQVEQGETLTQALLREIKEESGVVAEIGKLRLINSNLSRALIIFGFEARYVSGQLRPQASETLDVQWVHPGEVISFVAHPASLQRARDMLAVQGRVLYRAYTSDPFTVVEMKLLGDSS